VAEKNNEKEIEELKGERLWSGREQKGVFKNLYM
jgi:hypothetical protein